MSQPGNFTPILLYSSNTPTNVPLATNLTNNTIGAELAINIADKNLFFKDSGGTVNTVPIHQSSTSSNGWLSNTDWNTFNGKAPATSGTSLLYGNGSGGFSNVTIGTGISFAGGTLSATGSGGTVTSVTGTSPVVSSGGTTPTISLATAYGDTLNPYASKTANYILAAPNGSAGVPTFRALVAADLPSLSGTYIPYTGASSAIDLNAQTVTNIAHLGLNSTAVPDILFRAYGDNNSTSRIAIRGYSSNASSSSIRVAKFRGTFASPQAPLSGDSLGKFELAGYGTTSSSGYPQASYEGVATENWGATARGAKALFYVTPNTTTAQAVALTIDQDKSATFASTVTATSFSGSGSSLTGVVTSVTGTSPVVSSGGTTPAISIPAATTSVSGYLTSTDWNTFNNKGSGTVTSVAALTLGTTGTDLSSTVATGTTTPVITLNVPTASATNRGALSAADWTTFNNKGSGSVTSVAQSFTGGLISVSGSPITSSGTLALTVAGTSGGVPYFSSATTWATSAALAANALMVGGGAGVAPSTITTGTGVVTALGINTNTAGSFVVYNNGLGTPSSGVVTNLTGTASININGTVGATTPTTGVFTNVNTPNNFGFKNLLINAGFTINQRGYVSAATLATTVYGHDRWKAGASGGDYSFTQNASSTTITIATGKSLIQVVENTNVNGTSFVLSWTGTAQARYAVNSATPSGSYAASPILITGQTVGTTMSVEFNAGTLTTPQLEKGATATSFDYRSYGTELLLCQRYYVQYTYPTQVSIGSSGMGSTTTLSAVQFILPQKMRALPSFSTSTAGTFTIYAPNSTGTGTVTTVSTSYISQQNIAFNMVAAALVSVNGSVGILQSTSDSCYLAASAEL